MRSLASRIALALALAHSARASRIALAHRARDNIVHTNVFGLSRQADWCDAVKRDVAICHDLISQLLFQTLNVGLYTDAMVVSHGCGESHMGRLHSVAREYVLMGLDSLP